MVHPAPRVRRHPIMAALLSSALLAALLITARQAPAAAAITQVKGYACGYIMNVGLFGGEQSKLGCEPQPGTIYAPASDTTRAPSVSLPPGGSASAITATDPDGARGGYPGPDAWLFGGRWPCDPGNCVAKTPPSGPMTVSTQGTPVGGTVTSSAKIELNPTPIPVRCYGDDLGTTNCTAPGGYGPFPVEGDSVHVQCTATESGVTGSATFTNSQLALTTDKDGEPKDIEQVPNNPPPNYTRGGIISNVGDVFAVVYNEHIVNADGSLTVNGAHMYLFGPTAIGEVIKGQVTCGTTPSAISPNDTVAPGCGTPIIKTRSPEDPTPLDPRTELAGTFDSGGLATVTNIQATNATVQVGGDDIAPQYAKFTPGMTGPLAVTGEVIDIAKPMYWSFDVKDLTGNVARCYGVLPAMVADFGDDHRTDISVFRPSNGTWFIRPSSGAPDGAIPYGAVGDVPIPADYDGDGRMNAAIFRPSTGLWAIDNAVGADRFVTYGLDTDIPVPADYDGDGKADIGIFRPSTGAWYYNRSSNGVDVITTFGGVSGDIAVPADYDGDFKADLAIFRAGVWFVIPSSGGAFTSTGWGTSGDIPIVGDYDGDNKTDKAIYRPSAGLWAIQKSAGGEVAVTYGIGTDVPVPGQYDRDGKTDIAIFRPSTGTWFRRSSATGTDTVVTFGTGTDVLVALSAAVRLRFF